MSRRSFVATWPVERGARGGRHDGAPCDRHRDGKVCEHPSVLPGDRDRWTDVTKETAHLCQVALNWIQINFTGRRVSEADNTSTAVSSSINLDLITSDQYAQAYLDYLFSENGPVAELQNYFTKASHFMRSLRPEAAGTEVGMRNVIEQSDGVHPKEQAEGIIREREDEGKGGKQKRRGEVEECNQRDEGLKLSTVETQPEALQSLDQFS